VSVSVKTITENVTVHAIKLLLTAGTGATSRAAHNQEAYSRQ